MFPASRSNTQCPSPTCAASTWPSRTSTKHGSSTPAAGAWRSSPTMPERSTWVPAARRATPCGCAKPTCRAWTCSASPWTPRPR
ncbi:hypothetical protein ACFPM0_23865 [Pseudonocardia sulfidoxydans]|uniref:hypothetical protein n=1 Tax=Pseudonocardia sulfidoxydans TaxID=54011 RepID=UPI00361F7EF6